MPKFKYYNNPATGMYAKVKEQNNLITQVFSYFASDPSLVLCFPNRQMVENSSRDNWTKYFKDPKLKLISEVEYLINLL